eukprot:TRINITY_DN10809_c1_g1_i1.p3 TRINITY_DN10809_c1_g1~~TRINITY_DN10809_c1_g1_i1.p3  ORF type:complete len:100 (+),score=24.92 TRINITY_DN10809_c1_g1_i1:124-423(+)
MLWQACFVASSVTNSGSPTAYAKHAWSSFVAAFCRAAAALKASRVVDCLGVAGFLVKLYVRELSVFASFFKTPVHLKVRDLVEVLAKNLLAAVGVSMAE